MNIEQLNEKINEINSLDFTEILRPTIPVGIMSQEAYDLHVWANMDKDALIQAGLDWKIVDDLPQRAGALSVLQSKWNSQYKAYKDSQAEWKTAAPEAYNLRDELIHHFYHALYNIPVEYAKVKRIAEGSSNADMLQDLQDLYVLGDLHKAELQAIGMDLNLLDTARNQAFSLATILAEVNGAYKETSPMLKERNKAYTHLKEAVDEIRRVGQYAFWRNETRLKGYVSQYLRSINKNHKQKKQESEVKNA